MGRPTSTRTSLRSAVASRPPMPDLSAGLDLGEALTHAARTNPRLGAARQRWLAAMQRPAQEAALPDPLVTYTEMIQPIETRQGPIDRDVAIQQRIPFPGKLSASAAIAMENARVSRLDYEIALRDTVAEVKVVYAELAYLQRAREIVEENQRIAKLLAEKGAAAYGGGQDPEARDPVTLYDTLKAQSQLAQLAYDTVTLEELIATERARMNELLHRPSGAPLGPVTPVAHRPLRATREQLVALGTQRRQELEAALHRIRAADHARRLARLSRVPDFTLGVKYWMVGENDSLGPDNGEDAVGVMLGMTLPIWARKNSAKVAEAEHMRRAACLDREARVDAFESRLARVYFRMQNAARLVRLYGESLVPQARDAVRLAEQTHDTGLEPYGRVLEAQSVWLNFQLAYQRALADHEQMVARLEQLVGTSLAPYRVEGGEDE